MTEFRVTVFERGVKFDSFTFTKPVVTIGRSADADVRIPNKTVSRQQAELLSTSQGFALFAHKSTNVTKVRGEEVPSEGTVPLAPGDSIQIADKYTLELELVAEGEDTEPAVSAPASAAPSPKPLSADAPAPGQPARPTVKLEKRKLDGGEPDGSKPTGGKPAGGELGEPKAKRPSERSPRSEEAAAPPRARESQRQTQRRLEPPRAAEPPSAGPTPASPEAPSAPASPEAPAAPASPEAPSAEPPAVAAGPPSAPPAASAPAFGATGGAPVPIAPPVKVEILASARKRQGPAGARLVCTMNGSERALEVHDDFYIGGGADNDLHLSGGYAPRRAALLVRVQGRYRVYNTSPLPETLLVNGKGIQSFVELVSGDELQVYGVPLTFSAS